MKTQFLLGAVLLSLALAPVAAHSDPAMTKTSINGSAIHSPNHAPVLQHDISEGYPPYLPFIDTAWLWETDGWVEAYWRVAPLPGDTLQVFYSTASDHGPWQPGSDPVPLDNATPEHAYTLGVFYPEPYPSPGDPLWLFVRGMRANSDLAYSGSGVTYILP